MTRIIIDLPDTADLEQIAAELLVSTLPYRRQLGEQLQLAILRAIRERPTRPCGSVV